MSTLVAVSYPDEKTARNALDTLKRLQTQHMIQLDDAVVVTKERDKVRLHQAVNLTGAGAASGAFWGGLVGLIFLMPIAGIAIGAASGAISGKLSDYGVNDRFAKELGESMEPGSAALMLLVRSATTDRVVEEMKQFGGKILQTSLSEEAEQSLQDALSAR